MVFSLMNQVKQLLVCGSDKADFGGVEDPSKSSVMAVIKFHEPYCRGAASKGTTVPLGDAISWSLKTSSLLAVTRRDGQANFGMLGKHIMLILFHNGE